MLRKILGAVVGYVVYFLCVGLLFSAFSLALGPDRLFLPGNYDPSVLWIIGSLVIGFVCAVIAGYLAAWIGQSGAVKILGGIVVIIGVLVFVQLMNAHPAPEPRTVALPMMEAMFKAREPLWFAAINPILLLIGVFTGLRLRSRASSPAPRASSGSR